MKPCLFLDLDDTIFQTMRKCPPGARVENAASGRDGTPLSFITGKQLALFRLFSETMRVIPTTARSLDAFKRVHLPFEHGAILDYGGVILDAAGNLDVEWDAAIRGKAADVHGVMEYLCAEIKRYAARRAMSLSVRIIGDFGIDFYIVIKQPEADISILEELHRECVLPLAPADFYVHFNDNNIAIIPNFLNKSNAVKYFIEERLRSSDDSLITLGMGDSLSDLHFMGICDYLITPSTSQICRKLL
ncbi:MAG: hypothetical protein ACOYL3_10240 [Desulfuromonadaceae bacterium]